MKTCATCSKSLDPSKFYKSKASKDGLTQICADCTKAKVRAWALANPDRVKANARLKYASTKQVIKGRAKLWAANNPERRKEIVLASAEKNRDRKRASGILYHQRCRVIDLEKCREGYKKAAAVRRSRVAGNGGEIPIGHWQALLELFEFGTCLYCGATGQKLVMDHFVPVKLGGRTEAGNLLPCCFSCNSSKRGSPPQDWVRKKCGDSGYGEICWFLDITKNALEPVPDQLKSREIQQVFKEESRRRG